MGMKRTIVSLSMLAALFWTVSEVLAAPPEPAGTEAPPAYGVSPEPTHCPMISGRSGESLVAGAPADLEHAPAGAAKASDASDRR